MEEACKMLSSAHCLSQCPHDFTAAMEVCTGQAQNWASSQSISKQGGACGVCTELLAPYSFWETHYT